ncbi:Oidioi.mRNA.OKI2018_I69.chr1.g3296.t1.cds [Oikopleura dioica]|uniref:Oidioi.mRNA.OKI2018_I69.chr1.g3296.t1.cds n=1 Tax=Oikopleura dioica TaxID=34765 RepID=A0ABN7SXK8_OIKDI|nr:Oidioi.mRNA.OKI2018_I69.chr1.g3296.t1.cds [Oikopleura dioica]
MNSIFSELLKKEGSSQHQESSGGFQNSFNQLLQTSQPSQQFDISQQMQHLHQMRMLQSLGQYSQLGFSGLNPSAYGVNSQQSADHHHGLDLGRDPLKDHRSIGGGKHVDTKKQKRKKSSNVKRPTTAYLYFVSKYREELKSAGDSMPKQAKEMMQECAAKWRAMTDEEKRPYHELACIDKERWVNEKAAEKKPKDQWRPKRPPSAYFLFLKDFRAGWKADSCNDTAGSEDENENTVDMKVKGELEDEDGSKLTICDEDGPEKKMKMDEDKSKKLNPQKEITKRAGSKWNSMTEDEKAPYVAKALENRVKWEKQLQIYKNEIKNGKTGEQAAGKLHELTEGGESALNEAVADLPSKMSPDPLPETILKSEPSAESSTTPGSIPHPDLSMTDSPHSHHAASPLSRSSAPVQSSPVSGFPQNIASTHSTPPSIHGNLPTSPLSQQKSPNQQTIPATQMQHAGLINQFLQQHSTDSTLHHSQQGQQSQPMFHHQTPFGHHHQQQQPNQQLDQQLRQQHPQAQFEPWQPSLFPGQSSLR